MKASSYGLIVVWGFVILIEDQVVAFSPPSSSSLSLNKELPRWYSNNNHNAVSNPQQDVTDMILDKGLIAKLPYRELQRECKLRGLGATGTVTVLRERLRTFISQQNDQDSPDEPIDPLDNESLREFNSDNKEHQQEGVEIFTDDAFQAIICEVLEKAQRNHWKAATRKLKQLKKKNPQASIPKEVYVAILAACAANRLNGARASEPARKVMEQMAEENYTIPTELGNYCIQNCLGDGPNGTHQDCGGIDCALAMMAAVQFSDNGHKLISDKSYQKVITVLARNGAIDEALQKTKAMIVEKSFTPDLPLFAILCGAAVTFRQPQLVTTVLGLATIAGYNIDNIASSQAGRSLLATALVAAEESDDIPLGLRLLTAASKAPGCQPSRGDILLVSHSPTVQRAATLLHKRAIFEAIGDGDWELSVKTFELMKHRRLSPTPAVWRNVIMCCVRARKSRIASSLLLEWAKLSASRELEKPPLSLFNTIINACEISQETKVTALVLKAMKNTHKTAGNVITFNIALKRLAKKGDIPGCENIIAKMIEVNVQPNVVSYTTAVAACVGSEKKNPARAYDWIQRMKSSNVMPNIITYNTALAACLDGTLESTISAAKIIADLLEDNEKNVGEKDEIYDEIGVHPNKYTRSLCTQLMEQLQAISNDGDIDKRVANATLQQPLLQLLRLFETSEEEGNVSSTETQGQDSSVKTDDETKLRQNESEIDFAFLDSHTSKSIEDGANDDKN